MKCSAAILVALCGAAAADPPAPDTLAVELAGTLSGKTPDPTTGVRAAVVKAVTTSAGRGAELGLALLGRVDRHGAPAETGAMFETQAISYGVGLRAWMRNRTSSVRVTSYLDVTAGRTSARGDSGMWQHDEHTMVTGGILLGPARSRFDALLDFGWMLTSVGDGRIGPIASFGVSVALD